jgi:hypothetical protein
MPAIPEDTLVEAEMLMADVLVVVAMDKVPEEATMNLEVELVWKLMKSPLNMAGLAAIMVPEALPFWIEEVPKSSIEVVALMVEGKVAIVSLEAELVAPMPTKLEEVASQT